MSGIRRVIACPSGNSLSSQGTAPIWERKIGGRDGKQRVEQLCSGVSRSSATRSRKVSLNVLVAPCGFKESIDARDAARAIGNGVLRALPGAQVDCVPMIDGGEGFTDTLVELTGGASYGCRVSGPDGRTVEARVGFLGGGKSRTAVIEIAAAAGLRLVPPNERDVVSASSFGVGELISKALDLGAEQILIGCGDSGVNDGGAGLAMALGARFLDARGRDIGRGGARLVDLHRIDLVSLDPRLRNVRVEAAVNWKNALLGPEGVTCVYGPQKGASAAEIDVLERGLGKLAACIRTTTGVDVAGVPGAGASGGIGATLTGLLGAKLRPRFDVVTEFFDVDELLKRADLVITAEGCIDRQSARGKVPGEIALRAQPLGVPVFVLAGAIGEGAEDLLDIGVTSYASIMQRPATLQEAFADVETKLADAAEQVVRTYVAGRGRRRSSGTQRVGGCAAVISSMLLLAVDAAA
jgi:glycerate kinase